MTRPVGGFADSGLPRRYNSVSVDDRVYTRRGRVVDSVAEPDDVPAVTAVAEVVDVAALAAVQLETFENEVERSGLRRPAPAPNSVRKPPRTPPADGELSACCS